MLTMALAALLAVLGTVAVLAYVHQANNRAVAGLKTENVLVAKAAIPAGTKAALAVREGLLTRQQFPRESLPADPVQSISSATGGLVINVEMQPGQMLLRPMLVPATQVTASGGLVVPSGMFAVTVQLCVPRGSGRLRDCWLEGRCVRHCWRSWPERATDVRRDASGPGLQCGENPIGAGQCESADRGISLDCCPRHIFGRRLDRGGRVR